MLIWNSSPMLMPTSGLDSLVLNVPDNTGARSLCDSLPISQRIDYMEIKRKWHAAHGHDEVCICTLLTGSYMYCPELHVALTLVVLFGIGNVSTIFSIGFPSVDLGWTVISNRPPFLVGMICGLICSGMAWYGDKEALHFQNVVNIKSSLCSPTIYIPIWHELELSIRRDKRQDFFAVPFTISMPKVLVGYSTHR